MTIDDQIKSTIDALMKPVLERLATLEMVTVILSSKLEDAQCRLALEKFCGIPCFNPEEKTEIKPPPNPQEICTVEVARTNGNPVASLESSGSTFDSCIEYLRILDPENNVAQRKTKDIARYVGKNTSTVYQCLLSHKEDFENVGGGLWKIRTDPIKP